MNLKKYIVYLYKYSTIIYFEITPQKELLIKKLNEDIVRVFVKGSADFERKITVVAYGRS